MRFKPRTEKELSEMNLIAEGQYDFTVLEAKETVSKKGAPMIVLTLGIYDRALKPIGKIFDYLLDAMPHKLRHAAYGCALGEKYESGSIEASDFQGKNGSAIVGIQPDKNGVYPDRNVIKDYITTAQDGTPKLQRSIPSAHFKEDDIPF